MLCYPEDLGLQKQLVATPRGVGIPRDILTHSDRGAPPAIALRRARYDVRAVRIAVHSMPRVIA